MNQFERLQLMITSKSYGHIDLQKNVKLILLMTNWNQTLSVCLNKCLISNQNGLI